MHISRTLPPAAVPIPWKNIFRGALRGLGNSKYPIENFQEELKNYFGVKHCFLVNSGKSALTLILSSLHDLAPEKNKVLIPAFTCFSVAASIKKAGLEIKLCDMGSNSIDFDEEILGKIAKEETLKKDLLCVIPTHLFGYPANTRFCREIFPDYVTIIEDAAQAMGNEVDGTKLGTIGDIGFFSLGRGKALSTMEGGILVTNRSDIGLAINKRFASLPTYDTFSKVQLLFKAFLTNILLHPNLFWLPKSLPFLHLGETLYDPEFGMKKLSSLQAILADNWQTTLSSYREVRTKNLMLFTELGSKGPKRFTSPWDKKIQASIRLPIIAESENTRSEIMISRSARGLGIMPAYPSPINEIKEIHGTFGGQKYPRALLLSRQMLSIPNHEYMQKSDYQKILTLLNSQIPSAQLNS